MRHFAFLLALALASCATTHTADNTRPAATATTTAAPASHELRIYVARHGETQWNVEHRLQGSTDIPLDEKGKQQAQALHDLLAGIRVDAIYSSTLSRSKETAQIASVGTGQSVVSIDELRERNWGKLQGQLLTDPAVKAEFDKRTNDPDDTLETGESRKQFFARVDAGVKKAVAGRTSGSVLIVSHSGTNQMVLRSLLGLSDEDSQKIDQANDEVYLVELDTTGAHPAHLWKLITNAHLGDL